MNIESIKGIVNQLQQLGFGDIGCQLVKKIAFNAPSFLLRQKVIRNKVELNFQLLFEKLTGNDDYSLMYYDAIFRIEGSEPNEVINEIEINKLDKSMSEIDWQAAFDFKEVRQWNDIEKKGFQNEHKIEVVIAALRKIEESEQGRAIAAALKFKYWAGCPYQEICGPLMTVKDKADINQRFYFFEGQPGISVDEAFRFLQNKWQEKQLSLRKKDNPGNEETADSNAGASGKGLLQKRKFNNKKNNSKLTAK